jgi:hypothetical protein
VDAKIVILVREPIVSIIVITTIAPVEKVYQWRQEMAA